MPSSNDAPTDSYRVPKRRAPLTALTFAGAVVRAVLVLLGLLVVLAAPNVASAQARTGAAQRAQDAEARALFEEGRVHAEAEQWIEALDAFRRSRAVAERPTTIFNIATTLIRLGRAQEALATITELERVADPRQHARILTDAAEIRRQAEASLRHVTLVVTPADATVEVDGQIIGGDGAERTMVLDPGSHAVVISADGHDTERFSLEPGTDRREVTLGQIDAMLHVIPSVPTAAVTLDGVGRGVGTLHLELAPGSYQVGITAEGYLPFERSVELAAGAELSVDAALELVPPAEIWTDPLFWGLIAAGAVVVGGGIALAAVCAQTDRPCATSVDDYYRGTADVLIVPLGSTF